MHVVFMPYGDSYCLERFLNDVRAQKHELKFYKGDDVKKYHMTGQLRILPFGFYEYVFPKEDLDLVLMALSDAGTEGGFYGMEDFKIMGMSPIKILRKVLKCKEPPKDYSKEKTLLWYKEHVAIQVIGVREDKEILQTEGPLAGYTCEAI